MAVFSQLSLNCESLTTSATVAAHSDTTFIKVEAYFPPDWFENIDSCLRYFIWITSHHLIMASCSF